MLPVPPHLSPDQEAILNALDRPIPRRRSHLSLAGRTLRSSGCPVQGLLGAGDAADHRRPHAVAGLVECEELEAASLRGVQCDLLDLLIPYRHNPPSKMNMTPSYQTPWAGIQSTTRTGPISMSMPISSPILT